MFPEEKISDEKCYERRRYTNILNDLNRKNYVYRIFSLIRFVELLLTKKITLINFSEWDDPFENFLLKAKVANLQEREVDLSKMRAKVYGQSWVTIDESDALWRIYSVDKTGVKVKANVGKLFDSLYGDGRNTCLHLYFGKVLYKRVDEIECLMKKQQQIKKDIFDSTGRAIIDYFLIKRQEFEHEHEARIIYNPGSNDPILNANGNLKMLKFTIDPEVIIEEVVLDPRLSDDVFEEYRALIKSAGYNKSILKSTLYKPPSFKYVMDI